ncbi:MULTISPECIES: response regulator [Nitratireductor]|uniref:response regulator n=1 Tax=Nitratireductor TaxID=245876 RepID=UPI0013AF13AC|nr:MULTISPECIES: response regulator [Nitratireductor]MDV2968450.1 response regulator [Nitratireductor aquimarinus]
MAGNGSKPIILCVEDERHLRQDIIDELGIAGYEALAARDGREALAMLETSRPDLILCDITMPRLDGYGLLEAVRSSHPGLADVPFVFLTALDERDAVINGKRAGADDYLVKPIDFDLMLATIEARLRQVERLGQGAGRELDAMRQALTDARAGTAAGMRRVVDLLSFGVVLVSGSGVAFANRAAQAIHRAGDGLVIDRALRPASSNLAAEMKSFLAEACEAARLGRDHLSSLSVPRLSGQRDFLLTACALPDTSEAMNGDAQAVVFISDPERRPAVPDELLAKLFDLTPTEAQVARALAHGRRTDEIAQDLAVSPTTVAFHLRNLFGKTGTHRQADLIVLLLTGLASISGPELEAASQPQT